MLNKISISQFKTHCLNIMDNLQNNGQSVIITKRDKPIAKVIALDGSKTLILGMFKNRAEIKNDIISSIDDKWDVE